MVSQFCWDLVASLEKLRLEDAGLELFGRFLEESYGQPEFKLFLQARDTVRQELSAAAARTGRRISSSAPPEPMAASALQPRVNARLAIRVVRGLGGPEALRSQALRCLDAALTNAPGGALDIDEFLLIVVEEFHRGVATEEAVVSLAEAGEGAAEAEEEPAGAGAEGAAAEAPAPPPVQGGESLEVAEEEPADAGRGGSSQELPGASLVLPPSELPSGTSGAGGEQQPVPPAADALGPAPDDGLEAKIHQLVASTVDALAAESASKTAARIGLGRWATSTCLRRALAEELMPIMDAQLEALVQGDCGHWLSVLGNSPAGEQAQRATFTALSAQLAEALSMDLDAAWLALGRLCRALAAAPELRARAEIAAGQLLAERGAVEAWGADGGGCAAESGDEAEGAPGQAAVDAAG